MHFKTQQDVAAPIEDVFAEIGDFSRLERQAKRRHVDVKRTDGGADPARASWHLLFVIRGKPRTIEAEVIHYDAPKGYVVHGNTDGLEIALIVELTALSDHRTQLTISIDLAPTTMKAKLMVQSMRLAKNHLDRRFEVIVADYIARIEENDTA